MWTSALLTLLLTSTSFSSAQDLPQCPWTTEYPPSPVSIPIRNFTILGNTTRRAATLSVGTPPQEVGFDVLAYLNNIYMYPAGTTCTEDDVVARCDALVLGTYDYNASSTWLYTGLSPEFAPETVKKMSTVSVPANPNLAGDFLGIDVVSPPETNPLYLFPLDLNIASGTGTNMLGLGQESTLLYRLFGNNFIASNTWAYFFGLYGLEADENMDGSIVLGGFDAAKISGPNQTQPLSLDGTCATDLAVTIVDIQIDINGVKSSITNGINNTKMCVDPSFNLISLPEDMWHTMQTGMQSTELNTEAGLAVGGKPVLRQGLYTGNLTYILDSGLTISIPNSQLIQPNRVLDANGAIFYNASEMVVMVEDLTGSHASDMPLLGQPFLSAAYLMVNHDAQTFTLWESKPTTETNLVPVFEPCNSTAPIIPESPSPRPQLSPPALIGISFAVLAALVLLYYTIHTQRKRLTQNHNGKVSHGPSHQDPQRFEIELSQPPETSVLGLNLMRITKLAACVSARALEGGKLPTSVHAGGSPRTIDGGEMSATRSRRGSGETSSLQSQTTRSKTASQDTIVAEHGSVSFLEPSDEEIDKAVAMVNRF